MGADPTEYIYERVNAKGCPNVHALLLIKVAEMEKNTNAMTVTGKYQRIRSTW